MNNLGRELSQVFIDTPPFSHTLLFHSIRGLLRIDSLFSALIVNRIINERMSGKGSPQKKESESQYEDIEHNYSNVKSMTSQGKL